MAGPADTAGEQWFDGDGRTRREVGPAHDRSRDFMTRCQTRPYGRIPAELVEVGPTDTIRRHLHQNLAIGRNGRWRVSDSQPAFRVPDGSSHGPILSAVEAVRHIATFPTASLHRRLVRWAASDEENTHASRNSVRRIPRPNPHGTRISNRRTKSSWQSYGSRRDTVSRKTSRSVAANARSSSRTS